MQAEESVLKIWLCHSTLSPRGKKQTVLRWGEVGADVKDKYESDVAKTESDLEDVDRTKIKRK